MTAEAEWEKFKREVKRLSRRSVRAAAKAEAKSAPPVAQPDMIPAAWSLVSPELPPVTPKLTVTRLPPRLPDDPQWAQALERGAVPVDARLDLHHLTESAAYQAVSGFINKARLKRWRILLIITGRGTVLRQAVPRWVQEGALAQHVRWVQPASPRHGGAGAYYIVLARV